MINRLLGIIYILMNQGTVTAAQLSERFEVSVRTIYRDIDTLSMAGIPVYATKGRGGGIHLTDRFVLNKMLVSKKEQQQILAALLSLRETGAQEEDEILSKLGDFFMEKPENWVAIDFSDWSGRRKELFNQIRESILNHLVIEFDYYGQHGEMSRRRVEPVQLLFKDYTWYLRAFCITRQDMRLFKILRMKRVEVTNEIFEVRIVDEQNRRPEDLRLMEGYTPDKDDKNALTGADSLEKSSTGAAQIVLWIDQKEAYRIYDRFEEEEITRQPDGHFRVCLSCYVDDWIYGMILSFGPSAKVLEPEWMREELKRRILEMGKLYELP